MTCRQRLGGDGQQVVPHLGFVQKIEVAGLDNHVFFRARCEPEMRTGTPYKLRLAVDVVEKENKPAAIIRFAECLPCPAGRAPLASCKHIAALLYALEEVAKFGCTLPLETCTDVLQTWNQPHKRNQSQFLRLIWTGAALRCHVMTLAHPRRSAQSGLRSPLLMLTPMQSPCAVLAVWLQTE